MQIIPVIDLKNGVVVHAKRGLRDHYEPVNSSLCPSPDIFHVLEAFLNLYDFETFYIADLNAISYQGHHDHLLQQVLDYFPDQMFWIDKGFQTHHSTLLADNYLPVLGSESYNIDTLKELEAFKKHFVLSLDYGLKGKLGVSNLFKEPNYWPDNIIIMSLARVGSDQGPDIDRLAKYCSQYADKNFIAAGGIRDYADLVALKQIGVKKALMATALHTGRLSKEEIQSLEPPTYE